MRAVIDALMGAMLFLPGLLLYLYLMAGDTQVTNLAIGLCLADVVHRDIRQQRSIPD